MPLLLAPLLLSLRLLPSASRGDDEAPSRNGIRVRSDAFQGFTELRLPKDLDGSAVPVQEPRWHPELKKPENFWPRNQLNAEDRTRMDWLIEEIRSEILREQQQIHIPPPNPPLAIPEIVLSCFHQEDPARGELPADLLFPSNAIPAQGPKEEKKDEEMLDDFPPFPEVEPYLRPGHTPPPVQKDVLPSPAPPSRAVQEPEGLPEAAKEVEEEREVEEPVEESEVFSEEQVKQGATRLFTPLDSSEFLSWLKGLDLGGFLTINDDDPVVMEKALPQVSKSYSFSSAGSLEIFSSTSQIYIASSRRGHQTQEKKLGFEMVDARRSPNNKVALCERLFESPHPFIAYPLSLAAAVLDSGGPTEFRLFSFIGNRRRLSEIQQQGQERYPRGIAEPVTRPEIPLELFLRSVAQQLLLGVEHLHSLKITHNHLRPELIFYDGAHPGRLSTSFKISGLHLAKLWEHDVNTKVEVPQNDADKAFSIPTTEKLTLAAQDLYAIGAILLTLLLGPGVPQVRFTSLSQTRLPLYRLSSAGGEFISTLLYEDSKGSAGFSSASAALGHRWFSIEHEQIMHEMGENLMSEDVLERSLIQCEAEGSMAAKFADTYNSRVTKDYKMLRENPQLVLDPEVVQELRTKKKEEKRTEAREDRKQKSQPHAGSKAQPAARKASSAGVRTQQGTVEASKARVKSSRAGEKPGGNGARGGAQVTRQPPKRK